MTAFIQYTLQGLALGGFYALAALGLAVIFGVLGVVNFPPRQIGPVRSEVLTLGFEDEAGAIVLAATDKPVPNGKKLM